MTQPTVIRLLMLGLPIGLIISGVVAVKIYFREQATARVGIGHARKAVSRAEIQSQVEMLSKTIGSRHAGTPARLDFTVKYIQGTLSPANMGFVPSRQRFKAGDRECLNLVVEIPGTHPDHANEIVLTGAHYDSAPDSPGADANASGVAACLSLCQAFATTKHERTVRFVFFANGENPEQGSLHYAQDCKQRGENIVAMLNLSSLGYYSTVSGSQQKPSAQEGPLPAAGDFLGLVGHANSGGLVETVHSWFVKESTLPLARVNLPDTDRPSALNDDLPFAQLGYPAVLITDTAALRNPHFHQTSDTADTLDYERLTQAVKGLEGVIKVLANPGKSGVK